MSDYGHPLQFGTFISPTNSPAHRPVEMAQHSERLGFDLVTFQDHPYLSNFIGDAERGPAPALKIPIVLGAYKPQMLDLVGRKADGWLPSLPVMQPGGLKQGNAIIDDAAQAAGRDPHEITRLLNIFPGQTPEALTRMALEDGVSTFILVSDELEELERFAAELIPAVREQVARERT